MMPLLDDGRHGCLGWLSGCSGDDEIFPGPSLSDERYVKKPREGDRRTLLRLA
jgi:hypothetical protein